MHNLNLLLALGLVSALGRATPVLRGTNDTLSRRLWSEAPVPKPTFISQPISELPVPTSIAPHYSQPAEPSWILAPEPTEVSNSLLARQAHAPSEAISSDIGPSQPATPEPTFIAPQHGQPAEPSWVLAPEPTEVSNSLLARQAQSVSIIPSEPITSAIGPVSVFPNQPLSTDIPSEPIASTINPILSATSVVPSEPLTSITPLGPLSTNIPSEPATTIAPTPPISSSIIPPNQTAQSTIYETISINAEPTTASAPISPVLQKTQVQVSQPSPTPPTSINPITPTSIPAKQ